MLADYLVPGLLIAFVAWRVGSSLLVRRRLPALLQEGAQLVDVRSLAEFAAGNVRRERAVPWRAASSSPSASRRC